MSLMSARATGLALWLLMPFAGWAIGCGGPTDGHGTDDDTSETPGGGDDDTSSGGDDDTATGDDDDSGGDDDGAGGGTPWDVQTTGFFITGSFPQDGSQAAPHDFYLQVYFSEPYGGETSGLKATLTDNKTGQTVALGSPTLAQDQLSVGYPVSLFDNDYGQTSYSLHFEVTESDFVDAQWPLTYDAVFKTYFTCGETFDIFHELAFTQIGSNPRTATVINELLEFGDSSLTTGLIMEGVNSRVGLPVSFSSGLAGLTLDKDGTAEYKLNKTVGVTSEIPGCNISAKGAFTGAAEQVILPMQLNPSTVVYVYLYRTELEAEVVLAGGDGPADQSTMEGFELTGVMLGYDLFNLLNQLGLDPETLEIELDVDTDGDGFGDSASVAASSNPVLVQLMDCAPAPEAAAP